MGRRGRETASQKPPPLEWGHAIGRNITRQALLLEEVGVGAPHQAP